MVVMVWMYFTPFLCKLYIWQVVSLLCALIYYIYLYGYEFLLGILSIALYTNILENIYDCNAWEKLQSNKFNTLITKNDKYISLIFLNI